MPGPILLVAPLNLSDGGVSLERYRQLLADELGFYLETTATGGASGDTSRIVLSDDFRDDEQDIELVPGNGGYLYVVDGPLAGSQSRILRHDEVGYQGSHAAVMLARPLGAALNAGATVRVTSPLPVKRYLTVKGLDDCVNEGLARCTVQAMLTLQLTGDSSDRLSLADYPWLAHEDQILGVYDYYGAVGTTSARPTGLPYRIEADGTTRSVVFGRSYSPGETLGLAVTLPGDRLIYNGVTWEYVDTDDSPGLLSDRYRAAVPEHWILAFGMVAALRFLQRYTLRRRDMDKDERGALVGEITERLGQWSITTNRLRLTEFPRGLPRRSASLVGTTLTRTDSTITDPVGTSWP